MEEKPLKRHIALQPLSRDHHFSLLLCWKIRRGLNLSIDPDPIGNYLKQVWQHQLAEHFELEEKFVFPLLDASNPVVLDAIADHRLLKWLIMLHPFTHFTLHRIEKNMVTHIRLEERVIFPEIQKIASPEQLELIAKVHDCPMKELDWEDIFWK